jgi:hypothetical protein
MRNIVFLGKPAIFYEDDNTLEFEGRSYGASEGEVMCLSLPMGKQFYCGVNSIYVVLAKKLQIPHKKVRYIGACSKESLQSRLACGGFPIEIDGVDSTQLPIMTETEYYNFIENGVY